MSIITLTSDFGYRDYGVAALKGKLLCVDPTLQLIDITHDITPHSIEEAAYIFKAVHAEFPSGTIHLLCVLNFYQEHNDIIFFEESGSCYIGPNNGLFSLIFEQIEGPIFKRSLDASRAFSVQSTLSEIVDDVLSGKQLSEIGIEVESFTQRINLHPVVGKNQLRGSVVFIDRFGNATVNIHRSLFERTGQGRPYKLYFKRFDPIEVVHEHYMQVGISEPVCTFNSQGYLEIAVNLERADHMLGLKKGDAIQIEFKTEEL